MSSRLLFAALLVVVGCAPPIVDHESYAGGSCAPRPGPGWLVDRVVLVTLDGVRWQEIVSGVDPELGAALPARDARTLLPTLYQLIDAGVGIVEEMHTSAPFPVSLPGYREILTGRRGTACIDNRCPPIDEPTLLDELWASGGVARQEVALVSSWEGLALAATMAPDSVVVSAGRHGGQTRALLGVDAEAARLLETAAVRRDFVAHEDYRRDADTMALALRYFEAARPRFLHVALGDTDEHAHGGNYAGYLAALEADDAFLARLIQALDAVGGDALLVVATDHGRAASFRDHGLRGDGSDRVWMVAAGGSIPARGLVRPTGPRRLADIAPTIRAALGLPADASPAAGCVLPEAVGAATALEPLP